MRYPPAWALPALALTLAACQTSPKPVADSTQGAEANNAEANNAGPRLFVGPCESRVRCTDEEVCRGTRWHTSTTRWTRDSAGRTLVVEYDEGNDGTLDRRESWTWKDDVSYQITSVRLTDWETRKPLPPPGEPLATIWEKLNPSKHPIYRAVDNDNDGKADFIETQEVDAEGRVLREQHDNDGDGTFDHKVEHTLDARGEFERWANHDYPDADEACYTHPAVERDAKRRIIRETWEASLCDGDEVHNHTFDDAGNRLRTEIDLGKDGTTEVVIEYDYSCWQPRKATD